MAEILGGFHKHCIVPVRKLFCFHYWSPHRETQTQNEKTFLNLN